MTKIFAGSPIILPMKAIELRVSVELAFAGHVLLANSSAVPTIGSIGKQVNLYL